MPVTLIVCTSIASISPGGSEEEIIFPLKGRVLTWRGDVVLQIPPETDTHTKVPQPESVSIPPLPDTDVRDLHTSLSEEARNTLNFLNGQTPWSRAPH